MKKMKTFSAKEEDIERNWHLVDLEGYRVGRAASQIAKLLRGKHKPTYTPHVDCGDFVVCVNADKLELSGGKERQKKYRTHSQHPGGLKETTAVAQLEKAPEEVLYSAIKGMLPKNNIRPKLVQKLKVYSGSDHPHEAQQPEKFEL